MPRTQSQPRIRRVKREKQTNVCEAENNTRLSFTEPDSSGTLPAVVPKCQTHMKVSAARSRSDAIGLCKEDQSFAILESNHTDHSESQKYLQTVKVGLNRCFFCQSEREPATMDRSVSDSFLHSRLLRHLYFKPVESTPFTTETNNCMNTQPKLGTCVAVTPVLASSIPKEEPQSWTSLHNTSISVQSVTCSAGLCAEKETSDDVVFLLVTSPTVTGKDVQEDMDKLSCAITDSAPDSANKIERQVAYMNLPECDSGTTDEEQPLTTHSIAKSNTVSITSSEIQADITSLEIHPGMVTSLEIPANGVDSGAFSKEFVTDLTLKLSQLAADSQGNRPPIACLHRLQLPTKISCELTQTARHPNCSGSRKQWLTVPTLTSSAEVSKVKISPAYDSTTTLNPFDYDNPDLCSELENKVANSHGQSESALVFTAEQEPLVSSSSMEKQLIEDGWNETEHTPQHCEEPSTPDGLVAVTSRASTSCCNGETFVELDQPAGCLVTNNDSFVCIKSSTTDSQSLPMFTSNSTQPEENTTINITQSTPPSNISDSPAAIETNPSVPSPGAVCGRLPACGTTACSQCISAQEAQRQISRVLALVSSPLQVSGSQGDEKADGERASMNKTVTLTCLIATWESDSNNA